MRVLLNRAGLASVLLAGSLWACHHEDTNTNQLILQKCNYIQAQCKAEPCSDGKFSSCYADTSLFGDKESYDVRRECHGVHVGSICPPCSNTFTLNFGGAMREVSCQEFLAAIEKQNRDCGNCIKKVGWSPTI